jgi:hypothetical protein
MYYYLFVNVEGNVPECHGPLTAEEAEGKINDIKKEFPELQQAKKANVSEDCKHDNGYCFGDHEFILIGGDWVDVDMRAKIKED